ncbi:MAG: O-antigen ligase family protein [Pseudomonadota bacterium]
MTLGPRTFSPFLAGILVLWPIIAYMGAQGYTGAVAIAALLGLAYVRVKGIRPYALFCAAFMLWIVVAGFWAPEAKDLITGSILDGSFSMDMPGIRFALTALAGIGVLAATAAVAVRSSRISLGVIVGAALVQFVGVVVTAVFMDQILALLAPISDPVQEMPQNLIRNANSFSLVLPFLLAWIWHRQDPRLGPRAALIIALVAFIAFVLTGTQSAMVGAVIMGLLMLLVKVMPKHGFRAIFSGLAVYVIAMPVIVSAGLALVRGLGLPLPRSFFSRTYSWEFVSAKIQQAPLFGHGPEACHTWRDTFGDHPEWLADAATRFGDGGVWQSYPVVPLHPHNMPLQIWAETGAIGAALAAAFLFFLGWRLRPPQDWPPVSKYAAAGLIGVCISIGSFAYSVWNEAFLGSVVLAAAVILLQARHQDEAARDPA